MTRFLAVLFLFGTSACSALALDLESELRNAVEQFAAEHRGFFPDLRSTAEPISQQVRAWFTRRYYCTSGGGADEATNLQSRAEASAEGPLGIAMLQDWGENESRRTWADAVTESLLAAAI